MKIAIPVLALLVTITPAHAEGNFAARILAAHNSERAALKVPPLVWSDALAAESAVWARHLAEARQFQHSPAGERPDEGENLWEGSTGRYTYEEMVGSWAAEKQNYTDGPFTSVSSNGRVIGHYTQMIWRGTTAVGCALATGRGYDVLVCRYSPPGNIRGEAPY